MSDHAISVILVLIAATLLAVSQTIAKAVIARLPFYVFLALRSLGAVTLLLPVTIILGWDSTPTVLFFVLITLGGVVWPGVVNIFSYTALKSLPANVNRPIFQTYPAWAFVLSIPMGLGTFSWAKLAGVLLTTAGAAGFAVFNKDAGGSGKRLSRFALMLVAISAILQALGSLVWKHAAYKLPAYETNLLQSVAAAAFFATLAGFEVRKEEWKSKALSRRDLLLAWFSGMLLFGIGNTLVFAALKWLDPGPAGAIYSVNILLTALAARVWLGEKWTAAQAGSALLVLGGVIALGFSR
jgi:drug/metabolite transporter (DMT)-like permease